ncbi:sensor histidine kinase [Hymenobacter elongatus]|uniref:histidine kinase n=1 Tax=Hymenobacter elongatus TaxID=877208 RepID=A0A4Z0PI30_9BACT|nr:HAMP domain-containing sensor histidine kinase [Hymenobacter elongatus]TGE13951.1 HAMP domain-containing histidine kinase [Hymenobacter elongatus]
MRTNVDLDNFIYTASHDLKAPITNIEGLLHVLQDQLPAARPPGPDMAPVLAMMRESVLRFKRTIEHLSDVTKLQKEHAQLATDVPLADVLDDVRLDLRPLIQQTGARVDVDVATCSTVSFSAKNLRSAIYNLLSNALKYRHPDREPHIRVSCRRQAEHTVLTVQDNGLGLSAAQQKELFMMFRRLHTHVDGSGIGLYMVKKTVENIGSTFSLYFPI